MSSFQFGFLVVVLMWLVKPRGDMIAMVIQYALSVSGNDELYRIEPDPSQQMMTASS
jgi:hypothetical protein